MPAPSPFTALVLAGGGNRCLWQAGFLAETGPLLEPNLETVAGVSAGATMACAIFSGRMVFALEYMKRLTAANPRNIYPANLLGPQPVFPHLDIYRRAVLAVIDRTAMERLWSGPDIRVLLARPPRWIGPRSATLLGFICYALEKKLRDPVHPVMASQAGFTGEVVSVRECADPEALAELLLMSSCTPPVLPVMHRNGRPVLDGGLVDNVPVSAVEPSNGPVLVLLTRRYPVDRLPHIPDRLYVQPSSPISVYKWDYTNPRGMQEAYDLGRKDGERFLDIYRTVF